MGVKTLSLLFLIFSIKGLETPESVECFNGKIFISNVGKPYPAKKDGDGFIAIFGKDKKLQKFISNLNAPKGIAVANKKLFIADIDTVVVANSESGKVLKKIKVKDAQFLNDVAYDGKKFVYVSDTQTNTIYRIDTETLEISIFLKSPNLELPNGLAFLKNGNLVVASWGEGKLFEIDINKKSIKTLAYGFSNLDGVTVLNDGTILFSDFSEGKIYSFKDGKVKELKSKVVITSPVDINYCNGKLFVPEFLFNDVKVFKVEK
ncbi:MAG: ATP/GTP-binding protein [Desulfurobacteriaceae bacterium]